MKEINRIHIAKIAYDIEVDAKKDIEKYMRALERYADDDELLTDIEIRITELLAERGVAAGGVIAKDDIAAVREQLGEPSDFIPEGAGDIAVGPEDLDGPSRKLYRDKEHAILGGVLAGVANFFSIDSVWTRIIFIVLLFASFGTVSVIYLILWFIVPPARTAAEKLRMNNQPVTLASIKKLNEFAEEKSNSAAPAIRRALLYIFGIFAMIGAIGALLVTCYIGFGLAFGTSENSPIANYVPGDELWSTIAFGLFVISGILLTALGSFLAYSAFTRKFTKRIGMAIVAIIAAGLVTFGSGVGIMVYNQWRESQAAYDSRKTSYVNLPGNFKSVKKLVVDSSEINAMSGYGDIDEIYVEYRVAEKPRYELTTASDVKPVFEIGDNSNMATITVRVDENDRRSRYVQPHLVVYGPALETIEVKSGQMSYSNEKKQTHITLSARNGSIGLVGSYQNVTGVAGDGGSLNIDKASIEQLTVTNEGGYTTAGVVRKLVVTQPDVCPAGMQDEYDNTNRTVVAGVIETLTINDRDMTRKTHATSCAVVIFGDESEYVESRNMEKED